MPTNSGPASPDPSRPGSSSDTGRRRILYGRRLGRPLKQGRESALGEWLPKLAVTVPTGNRLSITRLFDQEIDDLWLEVGFGSGEHLLAQAATHPRVGVIGCEPFINGMAALLAEIAREPARAANIRVLMDDARPLIAALPDATLGRAFVLFPDPWPKVRHHKRRFIGPENLAELARVMKDGAELRIASDHADYVEWIREHLRDHAAFTLIRQPSEWSTRPADWPETRYEAKARAQGRAPVFLAFRRRAR